MLQTSLVLLILNATKKWQKWFEGPRIPSVPFDWPLIHVTSSGESRIFQTEGRGEGGTNPKGGDTKQSFRPFFPEDCITMKSLDWEGGAHIFMSPLPRHSDLPMISNYLWDDKDLRDMLFWNSHGPIAVLLFNIKTHFPQINHRNETVIIHHHRNFTKWLIMVSPNG